MRAAAGAGIASPPAFEFIQKLRLSRAQACHIGRAMA
jgi:hypothetical protein